MRKSALSWSGLSYLPLWIALAGPAIVSAENPGEPRTDGSNLTDDAPVGFYAAGKLQRVRRKDNGSERIALTDPAGAITAFLAPTARLDYRAMVGKDVAIKGRILNEDDDDAPYVSVDQISEVFGSSQGRPKRKSPIAAVDFEESIGPGTPVAPGQVMSGPAIGSDWQAVGGETIIDGQVMGPTGTVGPMMHGPMMTDGGVVSSNCPSCGTHVGAATECPSCGNACGTVCEACPPRLPDLCGPPGWLWVRGEYLIWFGESMDIPPLVTTSTAADPGTAGVLPTAQVLYGDEAILQGGRSGFRIDFGGWFGPRRCFGWEGEYLQVGTLSEEFSASSDANGSPVLARPFVNVNVRDANGNILPGSNDAQLVSFPGILAGTVNVDSDSFLRSAAGRFRFNACCKKCCPPCGPCGGYGYRRCGYPPFMRVDFTAGYRYANLNESLVISEDLLSLQDPERIQIVDSFRTRNDFHGGEIGTVFESGWNRWTFDMLMRLALGGMRQEVAIDGSSTITTFGTPAQQLPGGLLTQTTNIGTYTQNDFAMVPEIAANLGLYLTPRLRWTVGYTFFYLSNVVRPADQIDLDVNPDFIPPALADPEGLERPAFTFRETDFFAQGVNTGLDFRW